jgi:predicted Zn-dependent protease
MAWFILSIMIASPGYGLTAYTNKELDELEKEFRQQINQSSLVIREPLAVQYINHLGKRLFKDQDGKPPYFFIVQSNEINAFAGPGGLIGINTSLILTTESESELASVMAHEMAHVEQHHLYAMLEHQKQMRIPMLASMLASLALGVLNPVLGEGAMMASLTGLTQDRINFVRANEKEADRIGINYLIKANINPQGMIRFFKKMQENSRYYYTDNIPAILRTHPLDEDRIAESENRAGTTKGKKFSTDFNYFYFRELIRVLSTEDKFRLSKYYAKSCQPKMACDYGQALLATKQRQFEQAMKQLTKLDEQTPDNIFIQLALAESEQNSKDKHYGLMLMKTLYEDYPDNYAVIAAYAKQLMLQNNAKEATSVLVSGQRQFPQDVALCYLLARAENQNKRLSYAYFTQAQCFLLEGRHRDAYFQLKEANKYDKSDSYIHLRINALIGEIKLLEST